MSLTVYYTVWAILTIAMVTVFVLKHKDKINTVDATLYRNLINIAFLLLVITHIVLTIF